MTSFDDVSNGHHGSPEHRIGDFSMHQDAGMAVLDAARDKEPAGGGAVTKWSPELRR